MKMRVWAEFFTPEQALAPGVMDLLSKFDVTLMMAFGPEAVSEEYAKMIGEYGQRGIEVGLWVLLRDSDGYWGSERNADIYLKRLEDIFNWLEAKGLKAPWIGVDLEAPYYLLAPLKAAPWPLKPVELLKIAVSNKNPNRYGEAVKTFKQAQKLINDHGAQSYTAVNEFLIQDLVTGRDTLQDLMETPIFPIEWDRLSPMIYNSMSVGYTKGLISWKDARWQLYVCCRDLRERVGERASVSIGVTWIGKLENEPYYEKPSDMAPDVAAIKAAGIEDAAVFNIEGILRAKRPEDWFDMILATEPRVPEQSVKVDLAHELIRSLSRWL